MNNFKKEQLQHLIDTINPKQLSTVVKHTPELYNEIVNEYGTTLSEKIYNTLTPNNQTCQYGNNKKFKSLIDGYKNCGRSTKCKCTYDTVSQKVSITKQSYSDERKQEINTKRVNTTLEKYGVTNNGQTLLAKENHANFYQNKENVALVVSKVSQTKLERHNDPNYNNSDQIKATWKQMKDDGYWSEKYPDKNLRAMHSKSILSELYNTMSIFDIAIYCNVHPNTVYRYLSKHNIRSPYSSVYEQELIIFLNSLGITNIVTNKRRLISIKKEIDIFLPDYNIAIEYNGVFWHHDKIKHVTKNYHYDKFKSCEESGMQLLTIFSHMWDTKKDIIKKAIIHKLKLNTERIFARKCEIKEVSSKDSKSFLENTHVQGYVRASHSYGLYYQDSLVALMTFGKSSSRPGIGKSSEDCYELIRYASNTTVTGGASKLLNYFIKQHNPTQIQSYSANEWSTGDLYKSLGFTLANEVNPGYWYFDPVSKTMLHRYNFAKHILVQKGHDASLTEFQITDQLGLLRIWDCGKRSWILNLS